MSMFTDGFEEEAWDLKKRIAELERQLANVICYRGADGSRMWPEPNQGREHDERVRREALESAADALQEIPSEDQPEFPARRYIIAGEIVNVVARNAFLAWLRDRAKGGGNG